MVSYLRKYWNLIIRLGADDRLDYRQKIRLYTLNAFAFICTFVVLFFVLIFTSFGSTSALEGLLIVPILLAVLWLNSKRKLRTAKAITVFFLTIVVLGLALSDRRTGTEYILIAVACSSILIFETVVSISLGFLLALACYGFYSWYDTSYPFVNDPTVPYDLVRNVIAFLSALAVLIQLLVFRSLINSYALELKTVHQHVTSTNEELKSSNEELHSLSEQLDWIVKQKSRELQSYLDAINIHIYSIVTDRKGIIVKVNKPLVEATGFDQDNLIGKNFNFLSEGIELGDFHKNLANSIDLGKPFRGELKNRRKDGSFFWIDMVTIPLRNESGSSNYNLTLGLPITERKDSEERKERISKMLESIAFKTSHNVRGPMARILGLTNLINGGYLRNDELRDIIAMLKISVTEMDEATRELTGFINANHE